MRIPNNLLDCVCFLGVNLSGGKNAGKFHCLGTAFLIVLEEGGLYFPYLVTARHVIDEAQRGGYDHLTARVNKHDGTAAPIELDPQWIVWTSPAIDVAVQFLPVNFNVFDLKAMPTRMLATTETLNSQGIGPGDDLFAVGLFSLKAGTQRNIPIVRSGIISAMPHQTEPFTKNGETYHAYLAEMRSIGGLSGSPVFVYLNRHRPVEHNMPQGADWAIFCIGLIRGHWDLERDLNDNVMMGEATDVRLGFSKGENLNTGIAVVTPSQYIWGILNYPYLQERRKNTIAMKTKEEEPTEDASQLPKERDKNRDFTREDFQEPLRRASNDVSEPESEMKSTPV